MSRSAARAAEAKVPAMHSTDPDDQGCGPQPFAVDLPDHSWDLVRLTEFMRDQNRRIVSGEQSVAPMYWRLGCALAKARKQCARGEWKRYLILLGIEKTRCSKARAIFHAFSAVEELVEFTVAEAYAARRPRPSTTKPQDPVDAEASPTDQLAATLAQAREQTVRLNEARSNVSHGELQNLLGSVRRAIDELQEFERGLCQAIDAMEQPLP